MSDESRVLVKGIITSLMVGALAGILFGSYLEGVMYRRQAIEHNAARYHPQTGEFEWIESMEGE